MWINADLGNINDKDSVILANNRQVLAFQRTWGLQKGTLPLPQVLSWQQYLQQTWRRIEPNTLKRLISPVESRILIAQSIQKLGQVVENRLLDEIIKNMDYCNAHLIGLAQLQQSNIQSCTLFSKWIQAYQTTKLKQNLIDTGDLSQYIINTQADIIKPYIYGFKTLTPEQSQFFKHVGYHLLKANDTHTKSRNISFKTSDEEYSAVAKWALDLHTKHPNKRIAIVSPQLNNEHYRVRSIFDQVFDDVLNETGQKAYNISLGLPFTQYPLIQQLLSILQFCQQLQKGQIDTETFNTVVTSAYITAANAERSARALLVNRILSWSQTHFKLDKLKSYLSNTPQLKIIIDAIVKQPKQPKQKHDKWLLYFNTCLHLCGFLTDRTLSSDEYQLFNKYQQTSLGLNQLVQIKGKVGGGQAVMDLQNWLSQIIFQAKSAKTPIQILGSLEAEGLYFDAAWVLGMSDDFLPAALNSPRFIPSNIATAHQIPHSNFELIAKDSKDTLRNLINLADTVTFSYAKTHLQRQQIGSPLLDFKHQLRAPKTVQKVLLSENLIDKKTQPLATTRVSGGVDILKNQMACAFKGFVHRLNIPYFEPPYIGLNRMQQGEIAHRVLEKIYQTVHSHSQLLAYSESELKHLISAFITQVLNYYPQSGFLKIEKKRLLQLLEKFINIEKQRNEFSVLTTEQTLTADINGLNFNIRLDRVDEVENGEHIVFDYKTGNIPNNPWCGNPIKEPQLPIYALNKKVDGVAFIHATIDKIKYIGLSKSENTLPNKTKHKACANWEQQLRLWKNQLEQASKDYQTGKAEVLPTKNACDYCEYDSLCRIEK